MPITGSTRQCLTHFFSHDDQEVRSKAIATFVEVTEVTASGWQRDQKLLPTGYRLLRLRVMLDMLGYKVTEFTKLKENYQQLARQIVFGAYSFAEAVEEAGYSNPDGLYTVLLRGSDMEVTRRYKVDQLIVSYANETLELIEKARKPFEELAQPDDDQDDQSKEPRPEQRPPQEAAHRIGLLAVKATTAGSLGKPDKLEPDDTEVIFDRASLARALNAAIRLNMQLFEAVRTNADRDAIIAYLGLDLDQADVRRLIGELEKIFQAG